MTFRFAAALRLPPPPSIARHVSTLADRLLLVHTHTDTLAFIRACKMAFFALGTFLRFAPFKR